MINFDKESILQKLEIITELSHELNSMCDNHSRMIRHIQDELSSAGAPSVGVYTDIDEYGIKYELRYSNQKKRFIIVEPGEEPGEEQETYFDNASREQKVLAGEALPRLLDEVLKKLTIGD